MIRSFAPLVCLLPALLTGCGTAVNVSRFADRHCGMQPYGGVAIDLDLADQKRDAALKNPPRKNFDSADGNQCLLLLFDAPLSFVGDTLTLPIAFLAERRREQKEERSSATPTSP